MMAKKGWFSMRKGLFGSKNPIGPKLKMKKAKKHSDGMMSFMAIKRPFRTPWGFKRRVERKPSYYSEPMKFLRVLPKRVFAR